MRALLVLLLDGGGRCASWPCDTVSRLRSLPSVFLPRTVVLSLGRHSRRHAPAHGEHVANLDHAACVVVCVTGRSLVFSRPNPRRCVAVNGAILRTDTRATSGAGQSLGCGTL